jgi:hypothetical protein
MDLDESWHFVPDLASQLTFMLWQSKPVSVESAVRSQACALVLHFVLSKTPEAVENNYVHGLAAHLLTFMLQISRLGGRLVDFFEEAGEREAAVIRDFVQLNSNFKDNLFMGARVAESMSQKIRLSRQRRAKCDETDLSNVLIAPCLLQGSAVDTLRSFVLDVMRCDDLQKFIWLDGDCVFFCFSEECEKSNVSIACICGRHGACEAPIRATDLHDERHWLVSGVLDGSTALPSLDSSVYDSLAQMRLSPLNLEFRIQSSRVLVDLLAAPPKSAQLTALLKKTLLDLKQICRNEGLSVTGSKEDLASRIITHQSSKRDAVLEEDGEKNREVVVVEPLVERVAAQADPSGRDLDLLKKKELQGLLRQLHLPVTVEVISAWNSRTWTGTLGDSSFTAAGYCMLGSVFGVVM